MTTFPLRSAAPLSLAVWSGSPAAEDATLVAAALAGRAEAFDLLLTRYRAQAQAIAGRVLRRDAAGLEDVLAEAACRAWTHLPALREPGRFRSWYCQIVRNAALDQAYKTTRAGIQPGEDPSGEGGETFWNQLPAAGPTPEEHATQSETATVLLEVINGLEDLYRVPVQRRCLEEASYQEIAAELGKPVGTVKSLVHRGKGLLAQALQQRNVLL